MQFFAFAEIIPSYTLILIRKYFFFFNPFSVEIFKSVLANIIDSYYENQREMLVMCYYPSDEYLMCLSQEYNVTFVEEIDCSDISDGESRREKVVVYIVGEK